MENPLIYLVLGAAGSGRRELILDLIQFGLEKETRVLLLVSEGEQTRSAEARELPENVTVQNWEWRESKEPTLDLDLPEGFTHIFLLSDGRTNPVDQVEAFAYWLPEQEVELGRVITIVNAQLGFAHKQLMLWYQACIHFSDIVLINRREEVPQKWINDFINHFTKEQLFPCLIEQVRQGRVRNPALVLEPEPRRISLVFDELPSLEPGEMDGDEEDEDEDEEDIYLARQLSGRREKQIPDIRQYLDEQV